LGNAPAHELFSRISVRRRDETKSARSFADYEVKVEEGGLAGVKLLRKVG
jgi:CRISPR-associated protein Csd2